MGGLGGSMACAARRPSGRPVWFARGMANRRWWAIGGAVVLVVVAAVVLVWFEPQQLLIDERVDEAAPAVAPAPLAEGEFVSLDHGTRGSVEVIDVGDG